MKSNLTRLKEAGIFIFACLFLFAGCVTEEGPVIHRTKEGGYVLFVKGKPFLVKGVTYNPTPVGRGYDYIVYDDPDEPWLVDGKLMKEMGVNCIRIYTHGKDLDNLRKFIHQMYTKFGIYTIVGHWLGLWEGQCPNYANPEFREDVKQKVLKVVNALKDEEGVLMWVLGNENNYTCTGILSFWTTPEIEKIDDPAEKIRRRAQFYYSLVNDVACAIKEIDKKHLVALGNGEATLLDVAAKICKDVDVLALIVYRGKRFGNFFENVRYIFDKPVLIAEFGADSYDSYRNKEAQDWQEKFIVSQWKDIYKNTVFSGNKKGNCIGGVVFEWSDEWWKHNEGYDPDWKVHNTEAGWSNGSYYFDIRAPDNMNMNEEWFGLVSLSPEKEGTLNRRIPKKAYYALKKLWEEEDK